MKKAIIIVLVLVLLLGGFFSSSIISYFHTPPAESETAITSPNTDIPEPVFTKEGELEFVRIKEKLTIEIADNDKETEQGLMFRRSMPDSCGMLFIMPNNEPQSFWMKNTFIPLDIMFLDEQKKIVTIQANRIPFSEEAVPSYENAKYVLEVNAGYCKRKGIEKGDLLKF
ncbi:DUF192 domain-containing protein [Arcicella rosea]|uniref:Uncharacterized membrane protein (UPF0127 family) n=1 Tax=Arcicella rosea TaxID=502909 RepID=A0A841ESZ2_9BACT|nr:DUF192 domain-containing protein [Arcicella rosea]MBB6004153.1 uncharacterized membrane protein (UPF0127 family) [Arcicella rosea]